MSRDLPLRGPALHNPQLLSKRELVDGFVVRTALLERIADDLRAAHEQPFSHRLLLGQRGMGKTTLLHRIRYLIEDDPALSGWLPLVFPEEQYNVDRLSAFWMNCLDALGDALEARGQGAETLDDAVEALNALPEPERAARALELLLKVATEHNQCLVLLVDNVDLVLKRLEAEQWAVREILSHERRLALIGASSQVLEASYRYDAAFYEFFEQDELVGLTADETRALLLHLARRHGAPAVAKIVREHPERVEPLRLLTGGNPRTLALLYTVLAQGPDGDVRTDLEQLLDRCTPLYKARFEELSDQAQTILAELAVHWHPIGSADLSARCRLESRTVTGQLDRLAKAGIVQKVPLATDQGRRKQLGYQVAERFFNIWYLMRASRRVRRRLVWLVEFLRLMHTPDERRDGARAHLGRPHVGERDIETSLAYAAVVDDPALRGALEHAAITDLFAAPELRAVAKDLLDLDGEDAPLKSRADRVLLLAEAEQALYNAEPETVAKELWQELGGSIMLTPTFKRDEATSWSDQTPEKRAELRSELAKTSAFFERELGPGAAAALQRLFREGYCQDFSQFELSGALEAAEAWQDDLPIWAYVAARSNPHVLRDGLAAHSLAHFLTLPESTPLWSYFAGKLPVLGQYRRAEQAMLRLIALGYEAPFLWNVVASCRSQRGHYAQAADALQRALNIDPGDGFSWAQLAVLEILHLHHRSEGEQALQHALQLAPSDGNVRRLVATLQLELGRSDLALEHAQAAADLAPDNLAVALTLATALVATGHIDQAEAPMKRVLVDGDDDLHTTHWDLILRFFAIVAHKGHAGTAREWLDRWQVGERWLPLRTALQVLAVDDEDVLFSVAPEVAQASRQVLTQLRAPVLARGGRHLLTRAVL